MPFRASTYRVRGTMLKFPLRTASQGELVPQCFNYNNVSQLFQKEVRNPKQGNVYENILVNHRRRRAHAYLSHRWRE